SSTRSIFRLTRRSLGSGRMMIGLRAMGFLRGKRLRLIVLWTAAVKCVLVLFDPDSPVAVMAGARPGHPRGPARFATMPRGGELERVSHCTKKPADPRRRREVAAWMAGTIPGSSSGAAMTQRA